MHSFYNQIQNALKIHLTTVSVQNALTLNVTTRALGFRIDGPDDT